MGSKVYIANRVSGLVYTDAEAYGNLINVTTGYVKFGNVRQLSAQIMDVLNDSLVSDFLVLSGNNLICAIVFDLWMQKHGVVNVLHWDLDKYKIISMHLDKQIILG